MASSLPRPSKPPAEHAGHVFIRAGRPKAPIIYGTADRNFKIGGSVQLIDGKDLTIIAHGLLVAENPLF